MSEEYDDDEMTTTFPSVISPDRSPGEVERQVCSVSAKSPLDDVCAMVDAADWLLTRAKSIHYLSRQIAIKWIEKNGEFGIGDQHYSVGYNRTVRCTNLKQSGHQLLDNLQGDFDGFLNVLVAQPYKAGTARQLLSPEAFSDLFVTQRTGRLIAGAPERILKRTNLRFVR